MHIYPVTIFCTKTKWHIFYVVPTNTDHCFSTPPKKIKMLMLVRPFGQAWWWSVGCCIAFVGVARNHVLHNFVWENSINTNVELAGIQIMNDSNFCHACAPCPSFMSVCVFRVSSSRSLFSPSILIPLTPLLYLGLPNFILLNWKFLCLGHFWLKVLYILRCKRF